MLHKYSNIKNKTIEEKKNAKKMESFQNISVNSIIIKLILFDTFIIF
jgi:hypothetical protein